ncbi:Na/Pi cotransporter family protein [Eubacteriales bacterium OttesenSCG-928-G02]|nr:Na/Pi cotransporter family protein [Eubacteriales bacterium OttesenSCG-928-G02]
MSVIEVLQIIGGIAVFLYGMNLLSSGLERLSGGKLEALLKKATGNVFKGILLGTVVTALIQSSSASIVIVVGFVNSGLMTLRQAISVCIGANIGTTVTAWIISLTGISGSNIFLSLLKPINIAAICAIIGIVLFMFLKNEKRREVGFMLLGFAVLMYGLNIMSDSVKVLAETPEFQNVLLLFKNPVLGFLTGAILTAIIQSSSASLGMLQAIVIGAAAAGAPGITFGIAIPIILGQNVGTCITAIIASIGARKNAIRTALSNILINSFCAVLFLVIIYTVNSFVEIPLLSKEVTAMNIALIHTTFNLLLTITVVPFIGVLEKLICRIVKDDPAKADDSKVPILDELLLNNPSIAISQCFSAIEKMSKKAIENFKLAISLLKKYDKEIYNTIVENEDIIDLTEDALSTYIIKITDKDLTTEESRAVSVLLHSIADYERIGDHAMNIADKSQSMYNRNLSFSQSAHEELDILCEALNEILTVTDKAFTKKDINTALEVEPIEEVVDNLTTFLKNKHIQRLRTGECTIDSGVIFLDLLNDFERIADHCSNLGVYVIEIQDDKLDSHMYLKNQKDSVEFNKLIEKYNEKYLLKAGYTDNNE